MDMQWEAVKAAYIAAQAVLILLVDRGVARLAEKVVKAETRDGGRGELVPRILRGQELELGAI